MRFNIDIGIEAFLVAGAGIGAMLLLLFALAGCLGGGHV